jgi:hypothetical protein
MMNNNKNLTRYEVIPLYNGKGSVTSVECQNGQWIKYKDLKVVHCNIICEYCEGCIDLVPKENYSCFKGEELFYGRPS